MASVTLGEACDANGTRAPSVDRFMAALERPLQAAKPACAQHRPEPKGDRDNPLGLTVGRAWQPPAPLSLSRINPPNLAPDSDASIPAEPGPAAEVVSRSLDDSIESQTQPASRAAAIADAGPWQPALQMDRFFWPRVCEQLSTHAAEALQTLCDALTDAAAKGRKTVALAGCSANAGSTTLALSAARALARRGLRVILADAVRKKAQLAHRLGWIPTSTWEDVWGGRAPLAEAVVESVADHLAVLPRAEAADDHAAPWDEVRIAADLKFLRDQYELVLVDLGPLDDRVAADKFAHGLGGALDAVVLVHNVRATTPHRLAQLERWLSAAGARTLGVIQNFASG
jgi:protein-tyrosine kinase